MPRPTASWARHVVEPAAPRWELVRYAAAMTMIGLTFGALLYGGADRGDSVEAVETENAITVDLAPLPSAQPATEAHEGPEQEASVASAAAPTPPTPIAPPPPPAPAKAEPTPDAIPEPKAQTAPTAAAPAQVAQAPIGTEVPVETKEADGEDGHPQASAHAITTWQRALVGRIETAKRALAPAGRQVGTVRVSFTIDRRGRLVSETVTPSGIAAIDAAALDLIRRAAPFPTPPDGVRDQNLSFVVPIRFRRH